MQLGYIHTNVASRCLGLLDGREAAALNEQQRSTTVFVEIRVALLSRAVALVTVLAIELRLILADPTGSGGFTLLGPEALLLGIACYLALSSQRGALLSLDGEENHSA